MNAKPKHNITAERAQDMLNERLTLNDSYVSGEIKIIGDSYWNKEIIINNCIIEYFEGSVTSFEKPVKFINTHFFDCRFIFSFFLEGISIENCSFEKYLDFQAGGHNKLGCPVIIKNNTFSEFVNFFDCWYKGEVVIADNNFLKGTNIESKNQLLTFDLKPIILNNQGALNIESEYRM